MRYTLLAFGLALGLGGSAWAEETSSQPGACRPIAAACQAAGYSWDAKEKNLRRDCLRPLVWGESVAGVTVQPADVQTCRAHIQEQRHK